MAAGSGALPGWRRKRSDAESESNSMDETQSGSASVTGGDGDQQPVVVWEAANRMEAQIIQGRLQSEGIPAIIRGEALGAIYGLTTGGLAAADVLVPGPLAERALALLYPEGDEGADEEPFGAQEGDDGGETDHSGNSGNLL